jgi:hypothetical protein
MGARVPASFGAEFWATDRSVKDGQPLVESVRPNHMRGTTNRRFSGGWAQTTKTRLVESRGNQDGSTSFGQ